MYSGVATGIFAFRNANKTANENIGRLPVTVGQGAAVIKAGAQYNNAVSKQAKVVLNTIDEVAKIISNLKEEHKKARHIVYAYKVGGQEKNYSDKEPSGTTRGLFDLIHYKNLDNTLIVVIRYFGGTLLGAGPLTRTYTKVVSMLV